MGESKYMAETDLTSTDQETTGTPSGDALAAKLAEFPRTSLAHLPTPLEPLDRLSAHLGGPRFWVKRDDSPGLEPGGNKAR